MAFARDFKFSERWRSTRKAKRGVVGNLHVRCTCTARLHAHDHGSASAHVQRAARVGIGMGWGGAERGRAGQSGVRGSWQWWQGAVGEAGGDGKPIASQISIFE